MRQGQNNRRSRGRSNNRRSNTPNRNQTFDSNGPDTRIRGNASQVLEKYQALARDAMSSGDPIMAENYLQHAEHYQRVINQMNEAIVQAQLQAEQAREQRAAANPPPQPNGRAHPAHDGSGERRAGNGAGFDGQPADPREQPVADFGHDPREEPQPAPAATPAPAPETSAAPTEAPVGEPEAESEEKPRRRRGRPRRTAAAEEDKESAPASAE